MIVGKNPFIYTSCLIIDASLKEISLIVYEKLMPQDWGRICLYGKCKSTSMPPTLWGHNNFKCRILTHKTKLYYRSMYVMQTTIYFMFSSELQNFLSEINVSDNLFTRLSNNKKLFLPLDYEPVSHHVLNKYPWTWSG